MGREKTRTNNSLGTIFGARLAQLILCGFHQGVSKFQDTSPSSQFRAQLTMSRHRILLEASSCVVHSEEIGYYSNFMESLVGKGGGKFKSAV